jgi:triacylglycerol lipase
MLPALVVLLGAAALFAIGWAVLRSWRRRAAASCEGPAAIVLVHGFLGFDELALLGRRHTYFRGVAAVLEAAGARVYAPRLTPMGSVAERAAALTAFVRSLPEPRVVLLAHSMGGLDARYAVARLGLADQVAAVVTIGTPHRGTPLARIGDWAPARTLRAALEAVGVSASASECMTPERMEEFNREVPDAPGVYYASVVTRARLSNLSPALWPTHQYLSRRAGSNDGVVPAASQQWGETLAETDADHWAQIGWRTAWRTKAPRAAAADELSVYQDVLRRLRARGI